jgi:hypothetical protein
MFDFPASPAIGQVYAPASGPSWSWDGTAWKTFQTTGEMQIVRTFIPGNQSAAQVYGYYKPENLRYLEFEGVAAGGSAGPAIATGASVSSFGSGGGGGAWGKKLFPAASLPASVTITIGVPGAGVSNGNGQDGAATTFGSLVTLPGGKAGLQGANTAYSTWGAIAGSGWTAMPTGCDVAKAGQGSEGVSVNHAMGSPAGNLSCYAGRPGSSPWGEAIYGGFTSNQNSIGGSGYGWGSGATICTGSQSLRSSTTGGPGAVLLTEYIAVSGDANEVTATRERNILINGSCQISQEYGLVESTGSGYYMADQWLAANSGLGTVAGGQGWEAATARFFVYARNNAAQASVAAAAYIMCNHYVEGLDLGALKWGTSVATPAVLQFKAKAVVAGTYCVALRDWSGSYSFVYDFALAAGVWTTITVPIPIPYGGTWNLGSGVGGMFITVAHTVGSN